MCEMAYMHRLEHKNTDSCIHKEIIFIKNNSQGRTLDKQIFTLELELDFTDLIDQFCESEPLPIIVSIFTCLG